MGIECSNCSLNENYKKQKNIKTQSFKNQRNSFKKIQLEEFNKNCEYDKIEV